MIDMICYFCAEVEILQFLCVVEAYFFLLCFLPRLIRIILLCFFFTPFMTMIEILCVMPFLSFFYYLRYATKSYVLWVGVSSFFL